MTLTDVNTVASEAAKISNGAKMVTANSETLTHAHNLTLNPSGDFNFAFWIKLNATSARYCWAKYDPGDGGDNGAYDFYYENSSNQFQWRVARNDTGAFVGVTHSQTLTVSTWYFISCGCDTVNDVVFISINNGTPQTSPFTWTPKVHTTSVLSFGDLGTSGNYYASWTLDEVGLWSRRLSAGELTSLYNSGSGITYPF